MLHGGPTGDVVAIGIGTTGELGTVTTGNLVTVTAGDLGTVAASITSQELVQN